MGTWSVNHQLNVTYFHTIGLKTKLIFLLLRKCSTVDFWDFLAILLTKERLQGQVSSTKWLKATPWGERNYSLSLSIFYISERQQYQSLTTQSPFMTRIRQFISRGLLSWAQPLGCHWRSPHGHDLRRCDMQDASSFSANDCVSIPRQLLMHSS